MKAAYKDEMKAAYKANFQKFLDSLNLETSYIVTRQKHDKIIQYLTNQVTKPEPKFKHYVFKQNEFSLVNGILHKKVDGVTLPLAIQDNFFDILYNLHNIQRGHCGIHKIWHQLILRYHGMPQIVITEFVNIGPTSKYFLDIFSNITIFIIFYI